ncbi:FtsX-like permease family protein [bacterium]|nr:FtsX-like permease family protein [bacterium]
MLAFKLAVKNLAGAGLRTWLNAFVLSLAYVVIVWHSGLLEGWNRMARHDMIEWDIGGGEIWFEKYDPYDPFSYQDAHAPVPENWTREVQQGRMTPVLLTTASFYPEGRIQSVLIKGIDPAQSVLKLPADSMRTDEEIVPVMIGKRMADSNHLKKGDYITIRWRDRHGTFDAAEVKIAHIFKANVPTIDNGQIWMPIEQLRQWLKMPGEATYLVLGQNEKPASAEGWTYQGHDRLLAEMDKMIRQKSVGGMILYTLMLLLAMLAIFDTQVFSIFRRQKEIGTQMALGMTRTQVIGLFTIEGAMHGVLAAVMAAVYGIPLLSLQAVRGLKMPEGMDDYGVAVAEKIFPVYSAGLIAGTVVLVMLTTTIVSYWPSRKIAKMKPTDAIRGKLQ